MSHLHNIDGYSSSAAAEYQQYLQRLRELRLGDGEQEKEKKARAKRLNRSILPDQDPADDGFSDAEGNSGGLEEKGPRSAEDPRYIGRA